MQEYEKYGAPLLDRKSEIDELIKTPNNQYPLEINGKLEFGFRILFTVLRTDAQRPCRKNIL